MMDFNFTIAAEDVVTGALVVYEEGSVATGAVEAARQAVKRLEELGEPGQRLSSSLRWTIEVIPSATKVLAD